MRRACCLLIVSLGFAALAAEETSPDAKVHLKNIDQAIEDWDVAGAKRELAALTQLAGEELEPVRYFKGRIAFEEGRYAEAVELLTAAGIQDKPGSYLRLAKDSLKVTQHHLKAESEHFVFYYPKGKDEILVPYALETLEAIRKALADDLDHSPPGKVRVEIVNDARELAKVSTLTLEQIRTTGTIAICKFNKLMVTSPKAVLRGYDWQDTLAHEYVHLVVTQKSHNTVPIWLHEGLAKYLESRWRGAAGQAMSPSTLALLGDRVKRDKLIPFAKMHPSIALLPSAEDAATAFAEVFYAIDLVFKEHGTAGLRQIIDGLRAGKDDRKSVEAATGKSFAAFEKAWLAHIRKQPFPRELIPLSSEKVVLKDDAPGKAKDGKKGKEISFSDFAEVEEVPARKLAHLGELMRERGRIAAAAEEYGRAHALVGDKYESISNKYALALLELKQVDPAEALLKGSLRVHPGSPATLTHLGRIYLAKKDWAAARDAYLDALASDPFDPEVHLALVRAHEALGRKDLADRARKAAAVLTGLPGDQVNAAAKMLAREEDGSPPRTGGAKPGRVEVEPKGPSQGPENAPITVVAFSDFQCPACRTAKHTVDRLLREYPGKIRLVFRQYPLEMHPDAARSAAASLCAHEQGKFWPYHDLLFENPARLKDADLRTYAGEVGLVAGKFSECLDSGRFSPAVQADIADGDRVGVQGTPHFFVNGISVVGAKSLPEFKRIIDQELGAN